MDGFLIRLQRFCQGLIFFFYFDNCIKAVKFKGKNNSEKRYSYVDIFIKANLYVHINNSLEKR